MIVAHDTKSQLVIDQEGKISNLLDRAENYIDEQNYELAEVILHKLSVLIKFMDTNASCRYEELNYIIQNWLYSK